MSIERYFTPEAIQIRGLLERARQLSAGEEIQVIDVPKDRQSNFYQSVYDNVLINLEDCGEFEQFPLFQGLQIRRIK